MSSTEGAARIRAVARGWRRPTSPRSARKTVPLGDLARLRGTVYRLLGHALLYPEPERLGRIARAVDALQGPEPVLAHFAFYPQWLAFARAVRALLDEPPVDVQAEYVRIFLADVETVPCPPYESALLRADEPAGLVLAELERRYATAGLVRSDASAEPADHAAVELDFLAALCDREADEWSSAGSAAGWMRRERSFIRHHPGRWLPLLAERAALADAHGHFACICSTASAFLLHDRDLLDTLLLANEATGRGRRTR